LSSWNSTFN